MKSLGYPGEALVKSIVVVRILHYPREVCDSTDY